MRTARLLSTVAAAVLITGAAMAQAPTKQEQSPGAAPAPAAQQKAPAEKTAPPMHSQPGMKVNQGQSAQNKADMKHETTGQAPKASDMDKSSAPKATTEQKNSTEPKGNVEMKKKSEGTTNKSTQNEKAGTTIKSTESQKPGTHATTGQGAASAAKLSTEQRTRISTIIRQHKVEPAHLNVSVSVGTRVPESVHFYPLPAEVVTIYPEWRGYDYILVGDQIVVIDPRTHQIVAILEA